MKDSPRCQRPPPIGISRKPYFVDNSNESMGLVSDSAARHR
jgi:hypothetical protein